MLDSRDHEIIQTDPQLIPPLPTKPNRYMDHQLRLQHSALPQLSSAGMSSAKPVPPPRQNVLSAQTSLAAVPNIQRRPPDPATSQVQPSASISSTGHGLNSTHVAAPSPRPTSAHPINGPPVASVASGVGMTARNTRPKQVSNNISLPQPSPSISGVLPSNSTNALTNGTLSSTLHNKGHPLIKSTLDRVAAGQQDLPQLQSTRPYHVSNVSNGVNGNDHAAINMSLGVGNLQLKLPPQRRMNGENGIGSIPSENPTSKQSMDVYSLPQHLSLPRLPSTGTRST
jgi:hypothetical protein